MTSTARLLARDESLCLDEEIEELLWAERMALAESWLADEGCAADADPGLVAFDESPALEHWTAGRRRRHELVYEWERTAAQIAAWQAAQTGILAQALDLALSHASSGSDADLEIRDLAAELACAVGLSDRTVQRQMDDSAALRDRFPATLAALGAGRFSRTHAQVILEEGSRLADDAGASYERLVLDRVAGLTTGRLRAMAKSIAEELMPTTIVERHADARADRRVTVCDLVDGMAELHAVLPAVLAHGIHDRLTQTARGVRHAANDFGAAASSCGEAGSAPHDDRTLDQVRADILCDILLTGHATTAGIERDGGEGIDAIHAIVQITVPVQTLVGADKTGATLAGRCPIDPESARRLAGAAPLWDRVLTDPVSGDVLAVDRRFPTEAQRRHLRARDEHCRFPGCRMPVWRCDIDHTIDHQHGGPTAHGNLAHLCRRHHVLKHRTAWQVEQRGGGLLAWTSPLGRVYTDTAAPTLRFLPDAETGTAVLP
ncbi:HNH endonuclease signature motif containing protein [Microbacterium ulmi]|uniref:DUF222 domain-containing protein n=1 Tax=Microbacterium ulmi TaxID=179095 RepID=A0A7Y2M0R8_9MICO|nr:HNH endonuclease signature motif containing protein [Microbacterium ulmi]NII69143.1 hypothetical protein [Microbacterium ulmi]NNH03684.1 DUF222 domain-containing protein [Microbacterium ulmi]